MLAFHVNSVSAAWRLYSLCLSRITVSKVVRARNVGADQQLKNLILSHDKQKQSKFVRK